MTFARNLLAFFRADSAARHPVPAPVAPDPAPALIDEAGKSPFAALRNGYVSRHRTAGVGNPFLAICDIEGLSALKRQFGLGGQDDPMRQVVELVENMLPGCEIGRTSRSTIEFVFCARDEADARSKLETLSRAIEEGIWARDIPLHLMARFGALRMDERLVREEDLDAAECALQSARDARRNVHVDSVGQRADPADHMLVQMRDLRAALEQGELTLHYQPKLGCRTDAIVAVEGLLRWPRPAGPPVNIAELIEAAETTGAILELTRWVISQAVADRQRMADAGCDIPLNVNLSACLLIDADFIGWMLDRFAVAPDRFGIEITETALIADADAAVAQIERLVGAGIHVAIDDYGTGFSSLAYLQRLPIDELKIDRSFIIDIAESNRNPLIIRSTIDLAHALEMQVTAEGVEDPMAIALLRAMGCDVLQGYGIARPMPLDALIAFVKDWSADAMAFDFPALLERREGKQS